MLRVMCCTCHEHPEGEFLAPEHLTTVSLTVPCCRRAVVLTGGKSKHCSNLEGYGNSKNRQRENFNIYWQDYKDTPSRKSAAAGLPALFCTGKRSDVGKGPYPVYTEMSQACTRTMKLSVLVMSHGT